jgi:2-polyprenyl-6-methoxyphenol hydroxylase-like FAD-dependent oxidoreductase
MQVIIIGASPTGLAAAILFHQRNHIPSTIYEVQPTSTALGGAITIPPNALRLLDRLGVYSSLLKHASTSSKTVLHGRRGNELGELGTVA